MLKYNFSKNIKEYILALVGSYKALFIGLVGGYLGTLVNLPLPWLLGSLGLNLCFAFTNFKIVFPLPVGSTIFSNNYFWLHGRKAFKEHSGLSRELLRIRGTFFH